MLDHNSNISVDLLIDANCTKALELCDLVASVNNGPFAIKAILGLSVSGPIKGTDHSTRVVQ